MPSSRSIRVLHSVLFVLSLSAFAQRAHADLFAVGSGVGCTHSSVQAAINAAANTVGTDVIKVTNSLTYTNQALTLQNQNVYLLGRWSNCESTQRDATRTVLNGNNSAPVWAISGTGQVTLDGFELTNGNTAANGLGGGIRILQTNSSAGVTLQDLLIHNNNADFGGGIAIRSEALAPSAGPLLTLGPDVSVRFNRARHDGGGLYCRNARVQGNNAGIEFALNIADEHGGGAYGMNCELELSSPGGIFGAMFASNSAGMGGGMALFDARARVYTHRPDAPLRFAGNSATQGGAIAVVDSSQFIGYETRFDNNRAYDSGGAIYQFNGIEGGFNRVHLLRQRGNGLGVACANPECGTLGGNRALDAENDQRAGAVLRANSQGNDGVVETVFAGQELFDNVGLALLRGNELIQVPGTTRMVIENSLAHHNQVGQIVYAASGADLSLINSTLTDNALGSGSTFAVGQNATYPNRLRVRNSIVAEGANSQLSHLVPPALDLEWLAIENDLGLQGVPLVFLRSPGFVDPGLRDYRLGVDSTLRDFAPRDPGAYSDERDLLGTRREIDLSEIGNFHGAQDLGAIESQTGLVRYVFRSGFEDVPEGLAAKHDELWTSARRGANDCCSSHNR